MLFAFLTDFSKESMVDTLKGGLCIVGGFVVGYVFGMLAAYGFDYFVVKKSSPHGLHKVVRYTCALIVAIIVGLLYFNSGKGPGNGGDGSGDGQKTGDTQATGGTQPTNAIGTPATKPEVPPAKIQIVEAVMVRVFGGDKVEANTEKYFQVDDEPGKTDLAGVKEAVRKKLASAKGRVVAVFDYDPSASKRTSGGIILDEAKESLGAPLLTIAAYKELLDKPQ